MLIYKLVVFFDQMMVFGFLLSGIAFHGGRFVQSHKLFLIENLYSGSEIVISGANFDN